MLELKDYQQRALDALRNYFKECLRIGNVDTAFYEVTKQNFGQGIPYRPVRALPGLPYICLRMPTGGGKTFVACHAVHIAAKELLQTSHALVLWLVPSNAIREQTLSRLKDRKDPYHQALQGGAGSVEVLDVKEALSVQRATLDTESAVIVSTMQAFRVDDTEGRKVYEQSGLLGSHFRNLTGKSLAGLDTYENGVPKPSLANVLRLRRPIVIVDEAHNARTPLSFETLARFHPSCIIEFTATPDTGNQNVLHSTSAAELNAEAMIKLPIRLQTRPNWKNLLSDAVGCRNRLEAVAVKERRKTGEDIRPIMLLQAQPKSKARDTLTVEVVEKALLEDHRIPREQVVRATGEDRGLEGVDLSNPACPIRYVITVQALREGWDCPTAYVLCSVAEMRSKTAVEQILGRIMRLPGAARKAHAELNKAYAFAASQRFVEAAKVLEDALVENGFERQEARDLIEPAAAETGELFQEPDAFMGTVTIKVAEAPELCGLAKELQEKVSYEKKARTLTFTGPMHEQEKRALKDCFKTSQAKEKVEELFQKSRSGTVKPAVSPAGRREPFSIPVLAVKQGELFEQFEETHFLDHPWELSKCDPLLSEAEFPAQRPEGQLGEITVTDRGQIQTRFIDGLHQQMMFLAQDQGWTVATLVHWLDRKIHAPGQNTDITLTESGLFMTRLVTRLMEDRRFPLDQLVHNQYRLLRAVEAKIKGHREKAKVSVFQTFLLPECETPLVVTPEVCFTFAPNQYPFSTLYRGGYKFKKHYYPHVGDLKAEGEEFECAQFLDVLPEVKYWVRNLERRENHSFWLQTATDKFYPDFVCLLQDGRFLVVEYKGEHLWSNDDSKEKRNLGALWEARSGGKCLFIMIKERDFETIRRKVRAN